MMPAISEPLLTKTLYKPALCFDFPRIGQHRSRFAADAVRKVVCGRVIDCVNVQRVHQFVIKLDMARPILAET